MIEKFFGKRRVDLAQAHPGYGLVSRRQFDRRRLQDLVPRPVKQTRRKHGYGSDVEYPPGTREQVQALLDLESLGLRGPASLRLALWLEGYAVPDHRLERDMQRALRGLGAAQTELRKRKGDLAADDVVHAMVASHKPSLAIKLARRKLPKRDDLESALLILVQILSGTSPQDVELDHETAHLFASLIEAFAPGVSVDPVAVHAMFVEDEQFGPYLAALNDLESASLEDWKQARDDAILLRNTGVFPRSDQSIRGGQWFALRFGLLLSALSARRIDGAKWDEMMSSARATAGLVGDPNHPYLPQEEVMANGAQLKGR